MKLLFALTQVESFMVSNPTQTETLDFNLGTLEATQATTEPQFSKKTNSCLQWQANSCPDFDTCLSAQLSMEKVSVYNGKKDDLARFNSFQITVTISSQNSKSAVKAATHQIWKVK